MSCDGCSFAGQSTALEHTYVGVRFGEETNLTLCATPGIVLAKNSAVVVATEKGPAVGRVEKSPMPVFKPCQKSSAQQILREATKSDLDRDERRLANERRALLFARERARNLGLRMKFSRIDFALNGMNAVFYFTADGRVDFRQLVRDLASRFKTRVRMVQLGARDEAKLLGGIGICGKTLCCSTWIGEFRSISVQMAKRQGLSLNPTKISGQCGRLLCCLKYEDDQYPKIPLSQKSKQSRKGGGARQAAEEARKEHGERKLSVAETEVASKARLRDVAGPAIGQSARISRNPIRLEAVSGELASQSARARTLPILSINAPPNTN